MQQTDQLTDKQAEEDLFNDILFSNPQPSKWETFKKIIRTIDNILTGILLIPFAFFIIIFLIF